MGKGFGYFTNYPFHVFLILLNEFCERFSYYGMRAVLLLFLVNGLLFTDESATIIYHTFVILCYATPIVGAIIADGWLGKYRTILYLSIIYAAGSLMMTAGAIPYNDSYIRWLPILALVVIAFGTGGIKPCVSSFGGDQYGPDQVRQKDSFFSIFYLTINIGSLIATILIPYIRGNVKCFETVCYSLCFGIPAALMIFSIVVFVIGTRWYTINPAGESILSRMCGCVGKALSRKCSCNKEKEEKKEHWLDYAEPEYEKSFIEDVKDVVRVSWLFIPLPVFWALYDQQGSKWILQAQQMNGDMGSIVVLPDQISFLNPFLVVFLIPILESLIYPCLDKIKILNRPLQKMVFGMTLAGCAFLIAGFLQIGIDASQPESIGDGGSKVRFLNLGSCDNLRVSFGEYKASVGILQATDDYTYVPSGNFNFEYECNGSKNVSLMLETKKAYQIFITDSGEHTYEQPYLIHTDKGDSIVRFFNGFDSNISIKLQDEGEYLKPIYFFSIPSNNVSESVRLGYGTYNVFISNETSQDNWKSIGKINTKNGPVYTILITEDSNNIAKITMLEDIGPWQINIFLQTPQYFVMTVAELFFSPIGLGFSYSQAPATMKSILSAIWLLTVCFGNLIIIIVVAVASSGSMSAGAEFFLFAGLMFLTTIIYAVMCFFYKNSMPRDQQVLEDIKSVRSLSSSTSSGSQHDNKAFDQDELEMKKEKKSVSQASSDDTKDSGRGATPPNEEEEKPVADEADHF